MEMRRINDPSCSRYNHYGTKYDCMSIMHYRDYFFLTAEARSRGGKTMVAKRADCDLSSPASVLSAADIEILRKMYCADMPQSNSIKSTTMLVFRHNACRYITINFLNFAS